MATLASDFAAVTTQVDARIAQLKTDLIANPSNITTLFLTAESDLSTILEQLQVDVGPLVTATQAQLNTMFTLTESQVQACLETLRSQVSGGQLPDVIVTDVAWGTTPLPTVDATATAIGAAQSVNSITGSYTLVAGTNRVVLISVGIEIDSGDADQDVSTVTYNGVACTKVDERSVTEAAASTLHLSWWEIRESALTGMTNAAHNVVATLSGTLGTNSFVRVAAIGMFGVLQNGPDVIAGNTATVDATTLSTAITTTHDNTLLIDANMFGSEVNGTVTAGQTERFDQVSSGGGGGSPTQVQKDVYEAVGSFTSVDATFTTAPNAGEMLLFVVEYHLPARTFTGPGTHTWTRMTQPSGGSSDVYIEAWFRIADGTEGANYNPVFTITGGAVTAVGIFAYHYTNLSTPDVTHANFHYNATGATGTTGTTGVLTSATSLVFVFEVGPGSESDATWDNGGSGATVVKLDHPSNASLNRYQSGIKTTAVTTALNVTASGLGAGNDHTLAIIPFPISSGGGTGNGFGHQISTRPAVTAGAFTNGWTVTGGGNFNRAAQSTLAYAPALSTSTPAAGDHVVFQATIQNIGAGPSPQGVIIGVAFNVDGALASYSDTRIDSLFPGQTFLAVANAGGVGGVNYWTATSGTHNIEAFVDNINRFPEVDENNNKLSETMVVAGGGGGGGSTDVRSKQGLYAGNQKSEIDPLLQAWNTQLGRVMKFLGFNTILISDATTNGQIINMTAQTGAGAGLFVSGLSTPPGLAKPISVAACCIPYGADGNGNAGKRAQMQSQAAGNYNHFYKQMIDAIVANGGSSQLANLYIRLNSEFDIKYYTCAMASGNIDVVKSSFITVSNYVRAYCDGLGYPRPKIVYAADMAADLNGGEGGSPAVFGSGNGAMEQCDPGNQYYDIVGVDLYYNQGSATTSINIANRIATYVEAFAVNRARPICFPEWGVFDPSPGDAGGAACIQAFHDMITAYPATGPGSVAFYNYFEKLTAVGMSGVGTNSKPATWAKYKLLFT